MLVVFCYTAVQLDWRGKRERERESERERERERGREMGELVIVNQYLYVHRV